MATSMLGGRGWRPSTLDCSSNLTLVGLGFNGRGTSTASDCSTGLGFLRLDVVVAGVGGGTLMTPGNLKGGMLGTVEALFEVDPECAVEEAREFLVFVDVREFLVLVVLAEIGLRASNEPIRPFDDLTSAAATGGGTLMAGTEWIVSARKSAGREKLFPESCRPLGRGNSSSC